MTKYSANLGFLWTELSLPDAVRAAKVAGFDAVECHLPYDVPAADVKAALSETGLAMMGINTRPGNVGYNGLAALPDRVIEARAAIDEAISYASAIDCGAVHVMAGFGDGPKAHDCFVSNLRYASTQAAAHKINILIEPLNTYDVPGYFLQNTSQAVAIIKEVNASNLKLMFDCYHVQLMEGDLTNRLTTLLPVVGHIQFAGVPNRGSPDQGEVSYDHVFAHIASLGYERPLGAEYRPRGPTEKTLGWMKDLRSLTSTGQ